MFQPIFRLFLFRGSPADINGNLSTIATFAILLVAITWLMLPSSNVGTSDPDVIQDVRRVLLVIPLFLYAFVALIIFTVLNVRKFSSRFAKTVSAYLGVQLVVQMCDFCSSAIGGIMPAGFRSIFSLVQVVLFIWFIGVTGHIYRHAFSIKLYQGVLASIGIYVIAYFLAGVVSGLLFPSEVQTVGELLRVNLEIPGSE